MEQEAKIKAVFSDEKFVKNLMSLETPEEVQTMLRKKDLSFSIEEIIQIRDLTIKRLTSGDELSDEQLENVSGGILVTSAVVIAVGFVAGAVGIAGGVGIFAATLTQTLTRGAW